MLGCRDRFEAAANLHVTFRLRESRCKQCVLFEVCRLHIWVERVLDNLR